MQRDVLWVGNSNQIELRNLQAVKTGEYLNAATVACSVIDSDGNFIDGESFPKQMIYESSSDGVYTATLSHDLAIQNGQQVTVIVTAEQSQTRYQRRVPMLCLYRITDGMG